MAFTLDDLDTMDAAIASGIKRVTFADGRTTEYQSAGDMIKARELIVATMNRATATAAGRPRKRFAQFGSGL